MPEQPSERQRGDCAVCLIVERDLRDLEAREAAVAATIGDVPLVRVGPEYRMLDEAVGAVAPADVVLLAAGATVTDGWLERLRQAAYSDSRVATASAIVSRAAGTFDAAGASLRLRPPVQRPGSECAYVRRDALDLCGPLGRPPSLEFTHRCIANGLTHVLADDVLVGGDGDWPADTDAATDAVAGGPLARALGRLRRARSGLSVIVDAGILSGPMTGTQVHVLELLGALARADGVEVSAIVPDRCDPDARRALGATGEVKLLSPEQAGRLPRGRFDIAHRPYQVNNAGELAALRELADRIVITQQDLIGYSNPTYFATREAWESYRLLTRAVLAAADRALFFSRHARDEALAQELIEPARATVIRIGVDHRVVTTADREPTAPAAVARLVPDDEVMLCLGVDYRHKNRLFALELFRRLRSERAWTGLLVLAGPSMATGSSRPDEQRLLAAHPELAGSVLECGSVTDSEREWLYRRARLVVYPTVYEGFGLIPFEAAAHGVPCLWAPVTSLGELLPADAARIVPWDTAATVPAALELLRDESARKRNLEAIRSAGAGLRWDATAAELVTAYQAACDAPPSPSGERELSALGEDALRLVGPGGALPAELHRPLLALAMRPHLMGPVSRAVKLGYRTAHRVRLSKPRGR